MPDPIHYTLTGAADWPMLATVGGGALVFFQVIILALIGMVWKSLPKHEDLEKQRRDINLDIKDLAKEFENVLDKHMTRQREDCSEQRTECRGRYDRQFDDLYKQQRRGVIEQPGRGPV